MAHQSPEPGTADIDELLQFVGADASSRSYVTKCAAEAFALVHAHVASAKVPADVLRRARLEVGSELFHRRNAPAGVMQQFADMGAMPVRMARNPMLGAYPLLAPYLPGGFG